MLTNMLNYYYSIDEEENFEKLFKGLYVYENPTSYKNKYYIMNFNFSGINSDINQTLEDIEKQFSEKISDNLDRFINRYNLQIEYDKTRKSANMLSEVLKEFSKLRKENKIYIMIDEYDHFTNGMLKGRT